jgi:sarcosine oxidase subunit gamma
VLWLGPDEWLMAADRGTAGSIVVELDAALDRVHRSVLDLSSNRAAIDLTGGGRLEVLAKGCGLDLDPRSWRPGMCAQTLLARIPVILHERETGTRVLVRPSYLPYLTAWLDDAAG